MNFETLNELSYREIQAQAKSLQIAANQKKEVLIRLILEIQSADSAIEQNDEESTIQEQIETVEACAESAVEMAEETVVVVANPDMESAVEDAAQVEVSTSAIELNVVNTAEEDIVADVVDESTEPVATEMSMLEASFIGEVLLEDEECDVDFEVGAHVGEEEATEEDEGYWVEEEVEEEEEADDEELTEMLSDMQLRGLPTPQGKKTVFDCEQTEGIANKIDWGIDFSEAADEEQEEDYENQSPQKRNTPFKVGGAGATPKGKHMVFSSPELQIGSAVHWEYDAYDKSCGRTPSKVVEAAVSAVSPVQHQCAPLASELLLHAMTPGKALRTKEDQMAFWLAKGPKTPMAPKTPMR